MFEINAEVINLPVDLCSFWEVPDSYSSELECSIQRTGMITPVIVRRQDGGYQVCIGQRRLLAALHLGIKEIPGIVRPLNDDEIRMLRLEDSITQSVLADEPTSKIAEMVALYHLRVKKQGCRTDLLLQVRELKQSLEKPLHGTSRPLGEKWDSCRKAGETFGMSPRMVSRYLRVSQLCAELKQALDKKKISLRTAVELSFLDIGTQELIGRMLFQENVSISCEVSSYLRTCCRISPLDEDTIRAIVKGNTYQGTRRRTLRGILIKHGLQSVSFQEVLDLIDRALDLLLAQDIVGEGKK